MIKILLLLLLSFNCLAEELNECGMTRAESAETDVRCFEIKGNRVYESRFTHEEIDNSAIIMLFDITLEELENEYERID